MRTLSDEAIGYQVDAWLSYQSRGGTFARWLRGKDFNYSDEMAVFAEIRRRVIRVKGIEQSNQVWPERFTLHSRVKVR